MRTTPLTRVLSALEEGNDGDAHEALAAAWRERRSPRLAELAGLLDARSPSPLRARFDAVVAPRVAASLERLLELRDVDDPLLATFVLKLLESPPFTGPSSRPFFDALLDASERLRDVRLADRAPHIARVWEVRVTPKPARVALTKRLLELAASVRAPQPASADEEEIETALAAKLRGVASSRRTGEDLLADVYANPTDDAPRLVLADHLLERGDPRGELIMLQFKRRDGGLDEVGKAREYALLKKHGKEWLGPLAPVISWGKGYSRSRFERGFLSVADVIQSVGKKINLVLEDPAWATVDELVGIEWPNELLDHAPLRGLRRLKDRFLVADQVQALADRGVVFPALEEVDIQDQGMDWNAFAKVFPAVRVVEVGRSVVTASEIADLLRINLPLRRLVISRWWSGNDEAKYREDLRTFETTVAEVLALPATFPEVALHVPFSKGPRAAPVELRIAGGRYQREPERS